MQMQMVVFYANPFYVTRYMAPVYPVYLHNSDGTYALDADGNSNMILHLSILKIVTSLTR